jgi:hypothetical protein
MTKKFLGADRCSRWNFKSKFLLVTIQVKRHLQHSHRVPRSKSGNINDVLYNNEKNIMGTKKDEKHRFPVNQLKNIMRTKNGHSLKKKKPQANGPYIMNSPTLFINNRIIQNKKLASLVSTHPGFNGFEIHEKTHCVVGARLCEGRTSLVQKQRILALAKSLYLQ